MKALAGARGITVVETKDDRLMLTRHGDLFTPGGKFPRLTKQEPAARLDEIKRLLLALSQVVQQHEGSFGALELDFQKRMRGGRPPGAGGLPRQTKAS